MTDQNSNTGAAVNLKELLSRVDNDRELVAELFSIFKAEFPGNFQDLRTAVETGDVAHACKLSHTLKGTLSNLAVVSAAQFAGRLEQAARVADVPQMRAAFSALEKAVHGLIPEMETYLAQVHSL